MYSRPDQDCPVFWREGGCNKATAPNQSSLAVAPKMTTQVVIVVQSRVVPNQERDYLSSLTPHATHVGPQRLSTIWWGRPPHPLGERNDVCVCCRSLPRVKCKHQLIYYTLRAAEMKTYITSKFPPVTNLRKPIPLQTHSSH